MIPGAAALWALAGIAFGAVGIGRLRRRQRLLVRIRGPRREPPPGPPSRRAQVLRLLPAAALAAAALVGGAAAGADGLVLLPAVTAAGLLVGRRALASRRRRQALATLPDFLAALAAGLRAGGSVRQVVRVLAAETPGPLGEMVRGALRREDVGFSLDQIFDDLGRSAGIPAFRLLGVALAVQRRTGGSLAQILDTLVASLRERDQLTQEVQALTAQGRLSMWVLAALPLGLTVLLAVMDPAYLAPLWTTTPGHLLLAYAVVSLSVGLVLIRRMVRQI
jgi:tight adherence protein B